METVWFVIVAVMIAAYVVLDGFDLGAGIIYLLVGKTNEDRREVLRSIGPVWDGNEVWLLAAGGTLYFAYPQPYAAAFSGFYLPLLMVLWLLMLRGIGIELRTHVEEPGLARLIRRGVLRFERPARDFLWSGPGQCDSRSAAGCGSLLFRAAVDRLSTGTASRDVDWYTVMTGVVALITLTVPGALYVSLKTDGEHGQRAGKTALIVWPAQMALTLISLIATWFVKPSIKQNYLAYPIGFLIPIVVFGSLLLMSSWTRKGKELHPFLASCIYITGMLVGAVPALYPVVLPASSDPSNSLTIYNAAAGHHGLIVGLVWWALGMILSVGYFVFIYRMFRGKVQLEGGGY